MSTAFTRWILPLAVAAAGVVVAFVWREGVGEAIVGAAVCVAAATQLMRFGFGSQDDRDREEAARAYFDEHGHWPDPRRPPPPAR